ncbi:hypothetical protein DL93DRAFT_2171992 [Clavulina sp. PMI_390]|nr:hypothetical protein DL93DRAFT_2171992 [Clavulina sp. PMI_390]
MSEEYTAPTVQVLARGSACVSCRRRKQRCDGTRPVCQQCIRFKRVSECVFEIPRPTQVEQLEERIRELERMISAIQGAPSAPSPRRTHPTMESLNTDLPRPDLSIVLSPLPNQEAEPSRELKNYLLAVFFDHLFQFNFGLDVSKFRVALALDPSASMAPHPSLLNAMLLIAIPFAPASNALTAEAYAFEPTFSHRAHRHLDDALAHVDRLLDFLQATTLLAQYNLIKGKIAKGCYLASSALSFAIGCSLHRLSLRSLYVLGGPNAADQPELSILPPATTQGEMMERINVFSSVFQVERLSGVEGGSPSVLLDDEITTPWSPTTSEGSTHTVKSLYELEGDQILRFQDESPMAIRAKCLALLDRSSRLARQAMFAFQRPLESSNDALFWDSYHSLDYALSGVKAGLPSLGSIIAVAPSSALPVDLALASYMMSPTISTMSAAGSNVSRSRSQSILQPLSRTSSQSSTNLPSPGYSPADPDTFQSHMQGPRALAHAQTDRAHTLLFAQVATLMSQINVHDIFAARDESEREVALRAARELVGVVRQASEHPLLGLAVNSAGPSNASINRVLNPRNVHLFVGVGLATAGRMLIRERDRPSASGMNWKGTGLGLAFPTAADDRRQSRDTADLTVDIKFITQCLRMLVTVYPYLQPHLTEMEASDSQR